MAILLITYDIKTNDDQRKTVADALAALRAKQLSESSYTIEIEAEPADVYKHLRTTKANFTHLYIISLSAPWTGFGYRSSSAALESWFGPRQAP